MCSIKEHVRSLEHHCIQLHCPNTLKTICGDRIHSPTYWHWLSSYPLGSQLVTPVVPVGQQVSFIPPLPRPAARVQRCISSPQSREVLHFGSGLCGGQPAGRMTKVLSAACRGPGLVLSDQGNSGRTRRSQWGWSHSTARGQWGGLTLLQNL